MSDAADRNVRFSEPAKFLPVAFVCLNIIGLYLIYTVFHLVPTLNSEATRSIGILEAVVFNYCTLLMVICYVRCILVHPGSIPDKEADATWEYLPQEAAKEPSMAVQETKRSGDRRHCKWCAKYKPDRCHHCRVCRMCILKMDHHCPWIYNCVGFKNHKFFFLLLFYAVIDCHLIGWTMLESVEQSVDSETPFVKMFLLLFGETLAAFLGVLLSAFFGFHIYLMLKAMTTIEFCEKQLKRNQYNESTYDRGWMGNMKAVLGDSIYLWPFPCSTPSGDGLSFTFEDSPLAVDIETSRGLRRKPSQKQEKPKAAPRRKKKSAAGTGSAPASEASNAEEEDSAEASAASDREATPERQGAASSSGALTQSPRPLPSRSDPMIGP